MERKEGNPSERTHSQHSKRTAIGNGIDVSETYELSATSREAASRGARAERPITEDCRRAWSGFTAPAHDSERGWLFDLRQLARGNDGQLPDTGGRACSELPRQRTTWHGS